MKAKEITRAWLIANNVQPETFRSAAQSVDRWDTDCCCPAIRSVTGKWGERCAELEIFRRFFKPRWKRNLEFWWTSPIKSCPETHRTISNPKLKSQEPRIFALLLAAQIVETILNEG